MKKPSFVKDEIYHIYNRGVEKRTIFTGQKEYYRFIYDMFEFNDENSTTNNSYSFKSKSIEVEPQYKKSRKLLVEILAFVLMPNHFHLLLKQKRENGIIKFMQKLGTGYTMYFNKKHARVGGLFQGRFKAVLIENEAQYIHIPSYIHMNPLKFYRGSTSIKLKMDFLSGYKWSSLSDYIGRKNLPSLTSREQYLDFFGGEGSYYKEIERLLKAGEESFKNVGNIFIEVEPQ